MQDVYWNGWYKFGELVDQVEADYNIYESVRNELIQLDDAGFEQYFQRRFNAPSITAFNNYYESLLEFLYYIFEKAEEIEDYEFCKVLKDVIEYAEWKDRELTKEFDKYVE